MKKITDINRLRNIFESEAEKLIEEYSQLLFNCSGPGYADRTTAIECAKKSVSLVIITRSNRKILGNVWENGVIIGYFEMSYTEFYSYIGEILVSKF